ncbi:TetR/AcrR family transcriptional regulator [Aestuariivirga sp.]|uniref:TetR/AcrR family transcriptional regulator n=1 Tax=Aestuariivirga sp. TaxID=2650926 RepID=UPI0039E35EE6
MSQTEHPSRTRILDAAMKVIRTRGYAATTVDQLCTEAGLTKGGFFHHFKGKEDLAVAAASHFNDMAGHLFGTAPFRDEPDPLLRFLGYIDFRIAILRGEIPEFTCLLGTMVQEAYVTSPAIREACERELSSHMNWLARDIEEAREFYQPHAPWTAESLAAHTQAVLQGAFILAKAKGGPEIAVQCVSHLKRYVELLFHVPTKEERP